MEMIKVNKYIQNLKLSATLAINQKVNLLRREGKDIYHFGFGQSPFPVHESIVENLQNNATNNHYLPTIGLDILRIQIAKFLKVKWEMNLKGGVVIANPIPTEFQLDYNSINEIIHSAILESEDNGIKGKETTPFLLDKVKELTYGKSLEANVQLVFNNAKLAAQIAAHLI